MKRLYISFLLILFVSLLSCHRRTEDFSKLPKEVPVRCMIAETSQGGHSRTYLGTIDSEMNLPLSFLLGGRLQTIYCNTGDYVRADALLAVVDTTNAHSALESATASLRQAEDAYRRIKMVHDEGGVNEAQWVEMETKLVQARSLKQIAETELQNCYLRAPKAGVIGSCQVSVGQTLVPGQTVMTLIDTNSMLVEFAVAENEIGQISNDDRVTVEVPANGIRETATVTKINMLANPLSHSYMVSARLREASALRPGMVSKVTLVQGSMLKVQDDNPKAVDSCHIIVPANAIHTRKAGPALWKVRDNKATLSYVHIGGYEKEGVVVTEGLSIGDTIIIEGQQKMYDDCPISITM